MISDPSWLYSTIAQSSAAIVAIIGGFITASVLNLLSEKRSLINRKKDKETRIQTLSNKKGNLLKELEPKEILSFLNSIADELINSGKVFSLEEILQNYPSAQSLNLKILKKDYELLNKQILEARSFIEQHSDKIIAKEAANFNEWVNKYQLDILSYNYEILEREYNRVKSEKQELLSDWERTLMPSNLLQMNIPYISPISEQRELENLKDKIQESRYEISSLDNDVASLDTQLKTFSYPPNLGWGLLVLLILAVFGIIIPLLVIFTQAFTNTNSLIVMISFIVSLFAVFFYIAYQIIELGRK